MYTDIQEKVTQYRIKKYIKCWLYKDLAYICGINGFLSFQSKKGYNSFLGKHKLCVEWVESPKYLPSERLQELGTYVTKFL